MQKSLTKESFTKGLLLLPAVGSVLGSQLGTLPPQPILPENTFGEINLGSTVMTDPAAMTGTAQVSGSPRVESNHALISSRQPAPQINSATSSLAESLTSSLTNSLTSSFHWLTAARNDRQKECRLLGICDA